MPSIARGLTSDGAITWVKPALAGLLHREVDQRELELGADAGEEVEARARRPWRRARCRSRRASGRARCGRAARSPRTRAACRPSRARRSRPRRRPAPRPRRRWGSAIRAACHSGLGGALGGLGGLDLGGQRPWPARAAPASPRPAPGRPACRAAFCSAALEPRSRRSRPRRASSAASARSTTSADSPRLAWAARTRSGSSRSSRGSITSGSPRRGERSEARRGVRSCGKAIRRRTEPHPRLGRRTGALHTGARLCQTEGTRVLDRSRLTDAQLGVAVLRPVRGDRGAHHPRLGSARPHRRPGRHRRDLGGPRALAAPAAQGRRDRVRHPRA